MAKESLEEQREKYNQKIKEIDDKIKPLEATRVRFYNKVARLSNEIEKIVIDKAERKKDKAKIAEMVLYPHGSDTMHELRRKVLSEYGFSQMAHRTDTKQNIIHIHFYGNFDIKKTIAGINHLKPYMLDGENGDRYFQLMDVMDNGPGFGPVLMFSGNKIKVVQKGERSWEKERIIKEFTDLSVALEWLHEKSKEEPEDDRY